MRSVRSATSQNLNADTGTRIIVQYSGFPAGAQLFVPTVVAGSDATQPTAGGDLGCPRVRRQVHTRREFLAAALVRAEHGRKWRWWNASLYSRSARVRHRRLSIR